MNIKSTNGLRATAQTKGDIVLRLLQRKSGSTIAELAKATGWQAHSVRGFMSGTLRKTRALEIRSSKEDLKDRRYFVARRSQT